MIFKFYAPFGAVCNIFLLLIFNFLLHCPLRSQPACVQRPSGLAQEGVSLTLAQQTTLFQLHKSTPNLRPLLRQTAS